RPRATRLLLWVALAAPAALAFAGPLAAVEKKDESNRLKVDYSVWSLAFAPDGKTLLTGGDNDYVKVWSPAARKELAAIRGHSRPITAVACSADGALWASASVDTTVVVWDAAKREEAFTLKGHTGAVRAAAFSPDGQTLATGAEDKTVRL